MLAEEKARQESRGCYRRILEVYFRPCQQSLCKAPVLSIFLPTPRGPLFFFAHSSLFFRRFPLSFVPRARSELDFSPRIASTSETIGGAIQPRRLRRRPLFHFDTSRTVILIALPFLSPQTDVDRCATRSRRLRSPACRTTSQISRFASQPAPKSRGCSRPSTFPVDRAVGYGLATRITVGRVLLRGPRTIYGHRGTWPPLYDSAIIYWISRILFVS